MRRKAFTLVELLVILSVITVVFTTYLSKVDFVTYKAKDAGILTDFHSYELALGTVTREHGEYKNFIDTDKYITELNKNLDRQLNFNILNGNYLSNTTNSYGYKYELRFNSNGNQIEIYSPKGLSNGSEYLVYAAPDGNGEELYGGLMGVYKYTDTVPSNTMQLNIETFHSRLTLQLAGSDNTGGSNEQEYSLIYEGVYKQNYTVGENFDQSGIIINKNYTDGSKEVITNYTVLDGANLGMNQKYVKIQYGKSIVDVPITVTSSIPDVKIQTIGDYEYRYNQYYNYSAWVADTTLGGWGVRVLDKNKQTYEQPLEVIDGAPVVSYFSLFYQHKSTESLELKGVWGNKNVTNMGNVFDGSLALHIDLSNFKTDNVLDMQRMFMNSKVLSIDISKFNTSKVKSMEAMFASSMATSITLGNIDTSAVTNMASMFNSTKVTELDISGLDTNNVTDMASMFSFVTANIYGMENINTSNVKTMGSMFYNSQIANLNIQSFNTINVTDMSQMFSGYKADSLDLSVFNTSNVTQMWGMFKSAQINNINISSFDTSKVTNMGYMFNLCTSPIVDLSSFNMSKVGNTNEMFYQSFITKVYARSSADATKLSSSSNKPAGLTVFVGKP